MPPQATGPHVDRNKCKLLRTLRSRAMRRLRHCRNKSNHAGLAQANGLSKPVRFKVLAGGVRNGKAGLASLGLTALMRQPSLTLELLAPTVQPTNLANPVHDSYLPGAQK